MQPSPPIRSRSRNAVINLGLAAASVVFFLALCEFVVFRFVLPGSDVPRNAYIDEVVRYEPGQSGIWRVRDEIAAPFAINARGWNSRLGDYPRERRPGAARIAVVGDSFVEAFQVPVGRSFSEAVAAGSGAEVYRYGLAGAPMSQYLHMVEREVLADRPDTIVILLIHNDFDESFVTKPGRYTSSFRKLAVANGHVTGEIAPSPWRPGAFEWLRQSALARFFLYRWQVRPQVLVDAILGPARAAEPRFAANVDIAEVMSRRADIRAATFHVVRRLAELARGNGARLLLVMDGDRAAIEAGRGESPALELNAIAAEAAAAHAVPFLDLHPVFAADWGRLRKPFAFVADAHWNEHGHAVAGAAVLEKVRER